MIVIAAILTTFEGKGDEYQEKIKELAPKVRRDPGTIEYTIHRMTDNPSKFLVYERYENMEALKMHPLTPHFKAYRQETS